MTYEIVTSKDGKQKGIKCLDCGLTSWHYKDVEEKYCGNCHEFHELKEKMKKLNKKYINPKTGKKYGYYSPEGKGYEDVLGWAKDFEPPKDEKAREKWFKKVRIVKQETTWLGFWVSTVWLGLDHSWGEDSEPLIFESMVFYKGHSDLDMNRYTTKAQAKAGHAQMVKNWSNPFFVLWKIIDRKTWTLQWKWERFVTNMKNPEFRREVLYNLLHLFWFALSLIAFIGWFFLPYYPWLRPWMSFGMGSMFVHSAMWFWKGRGAIKHEVWCRGRKECGE